MQFKNFVFDRDQKLFVQDIYKKVFKENNINDRFTIIDIVSNALEVKTVAMLDHYEHIYYFDNQLEDCFLIKDSNVECIRIDYVFNDILSSFKEILTMNLMSEYFRYKNDIPCELHDIKIMKCVENDFVTEQHIDEHNYLMKLIQKMYKKNYTQAFEKGIFSDAFIYLISYLTNANDFLEYMIKKYKSDRIMEEIHILFSKAVYMEKLKNLEINNQYIRKRLYEKLYDKTFDIVTLGINLEKETVEYKIAFDYLISCVRSEDEIYVPCNYQYKALFNMLMSNNGISTLSFDQIEYVKYGNHVIYDCKNTTGGMQL